MLTFLVANIHRSVVRSEVAKCAFSGFFDVLWASYEMKEASIFVEQAGFTETREVVKTT
jgi:hypothetical protein